jgi:predicted esterase
MKLKNLLITLIIGVVLLGACDAPAPSTVPQETPTSTSSLVPQETFTSPTQTFTPTATPTPSSTTSTPPIHPTPPTSTSQPTQPSQPTKPAEWTEAERIEPNRAKGFNYPYYLYIPTTIQKTNQTNYLLVEGNNSGGVASDEQTVHDAAAKKIAEKKDAPLAEALGTPLLVPAFPVPLKYNPGGTGSIVMNTQALDRSTLLTNDNDLKRLDLQLITMIDDAIQRLSQRGINLQNKVLIDGFSSSGAFANRFIILHPDRIQAATVGPCMGWPVAPLAEWEGTTLNYPMGVADLNQIVGNDFDIQTFRTVPLYFYLGDQDPDQMGGEEQQLMFQYGSTAAARFPEAEKIYESVGCTCQFVLYPGVAHEVSSDELEDIITFFSNHLTPR